MINSGLFYFFGRIPPHCGPRLDIGFVFIDNRVVSVSSPKREGERLGGAEGIVKVRLI